MSSLPSDQAFQVEPGRPRDIFFFIAEVVSGAWRRHFGARFCSLPMTEKEFGMRCAKAILARLLPSWCVTSTDQFVVVRHGRGVVGAALSSTHTSRATAPMTAIEVVVVAERWRGQGIGRRLVVYFQKHTPPGGLLECYCTTESRTMARVLKRLKFHRTHKVIETKIRTGLNLRHPERWEWQAGAVHRPLNHVPRKAGIEDQLANKIAAMRMS
ncbi:GNAT family N-acetyltransferase [Dyella flagellata]|uniref:GNAT family N-acetyltransferase n=1 Tax=Dyella flagellata TaxID=1867833 RepID=UPI0024E113BE|nr:GNAT family N-acetyltransferase [Dyella flagellata]